MKFVTVLVFSLMIANALSAQYVYTINADSVKITNHCDTAELILENHTQTVPGFLYNKGRGRTEFRKVLQKVNDTLYMVGPDTLKVPSGAVGAANGLHMDNNVVKLGGTLTESTIIFQKENEVELRDSATGSTEILGGSLLSTTGGGAGADYGSELWFNPAGFGAAGPDIILQLTGGAALNPTIVFGGPNFSSSLSNTQGTFTLTTGITGGGNQGKLSLTAASKVGIGTTTPTAYLQLHNGLSTAGGAPLKFNTGGLMVIPEAGAVEYDGTDLYLTQGTTRYKLSKTLTGQLTTSFGAPSLTAFNSVTTTLTVTGAQAGDIVSVSANSGAVNPPSIIITAYVTSSNTVTLQAYNASNSAVTLASDTYKVRLMH